MNSLDIPRPDDWHVHFRDNAMLAHTLPATAHTFARALVMPNLSSPLTTLNALLAYRERVLQALPPALSFTPYFSLYLNEHVSPEDLMRAKAYPFIVGAKLYPAQVTTHSEHGVQSFKALYPLFSLLQEQSLVLQVHGELPHCDIFDRESAFITEVLIPITRNFPRLRIVLEHISSQIAVDYLEQASSLVVATLTPHHLRYNRNDLFEGGRLHPHLFCAPLLKRRRDQQALLRAAFSGNPKFFAGTDSAPHPLAHKETACGCAGIFSAPFAAALYADCFDQHQQLPQLEKFLSHYGADFYQLPLNKERLFFSKRPQTIPDTLPLGDSHVVPLLAGQTLAWSAHDTPL